ncbi:MAG: permease [Cyanobacteria bacterium J06642_2]
MNWTCKPISSTSSIFWGSVHDGTSSELYQSHYCSLEWSGVGDRCLGGGALPAQATKSVWFTLQNYVQVLPFLLLSVAAAAYAQASGADNLIARTFQGKIWRTIIMGAFVGAFSPFCSCEVIPVIAALLSIGVPLPAVMAFWVFSPLMEPSMFALTMGALGPHFAAGKTIATVGIGLLGGFGTLPLMQQFPFANPLQEGAGNGERNRALTSLGLSIPRRRLSGECQEMF